jgi:hypothetical protein
MALVLTADTTNNYTVNDGSQGVSVDGSRNVYVVGTNKGMETGDIGTFPW